MNASMNQTPAHAVTIPEDVARIAIEAWPAEDPSQGIIWDRTGHEDYNGEWGSQLLEWVGGLDDVTAAVERAGFTVGEFVAHELGDGAELLAVAHRDGA